MSGIEPPWREGSRPCLACLRRPPARLPTRAHTAAWHQRALKWRNKPPPNCSTAASRRRTGRTEMPPQPSHACRLRSSVAHAVHHQHRHGRMPAARSRGVAPYAACRAQPAPSCPTLHIGYPMPHGPAAAPYKVVCQRAVQCALRGAARVWRQGQQRHVQLARPLQQRGADALAAAARSNHHLHALRARGEGSCVCRAHCHLPWRPPAARRTCAHGKRPAASATVFFGEACCEL